MTVGDHPKTGLPIVVRIGRYGPYLQYEDESGEKYLAIEQWGETEFEASLGQPVEEYQFSDILPGESG